MCVCVLPRENSRVMRSIFSFVSASLWNASTAWEISHRVCTSRNSSFSSSWIRRHAHTSAHGLPQSTTIANGLYFLFVFYYRNHDYFSLSNNKFSICRNCNYNPHSHMIRKIGLLPKY